MNISEGNFRYNGVPIFEVGFIDFYTVINCLENNKRILSRNLQSESLREYYKHSRNNAFGICYEGVIVDLRKFKK